MSSAFSLPRSATSARPARQQHPAWASPLLWQFVPMLAIALVAALVVPAVIYYRQGAVTLQRQNDLTALIAKLSTSDELTDEQIAVLATASISGSESLTADITRAREEFEGAQQQLAQLRRKASERVSFVALARAATSRQRAEAMKVKDLIHELSAENARWQTECGPVLTSDSGRRIVANSEHLERVLPVLREKPFNPRDFEGWNSTLDDLLAPLEHAFEHNSGDAVFSKTHLAQIASIGESVQKALDNLRRARLVVTTAVIETASCSPAAQTLDDVIETRKIADAKRVEQLVEDARQSERTRQVAALQKAEQEKIALAHQVQLLETTHATADLKRDIDTLVTSWNAKKRQEEEEEANRIDSEFRAALPEIRRYLSAFTSEGRTFRMDRTTSGPMSMTRIKSSGVFKPGAQGYLCISYLMAKNDRPSGPLPRRAGQLSDVEWEACKKAQQLLTQFGQKLIQYRMLAE